MAGPSDHIDIKLFDMVLCLCRAIDFLHPQISEHHLRVAYIAACLAEGLGLDLEATQNLLIAGVLHDVAAVAPAAPLALFDGALTCFHDGQSRASDALHRHGVEGALLLRDFPPFAQAASAIRFHHVNWDFGWGREFGGEAVPLSSHVLRLADRVAVLPHEGQNILEQVAGIRATVIAGSERLFKPAVVAAFAAMSEKESFWLDLTSRHKEAILQRRFGAPKVRLNLDGLYRLSRVFGKIIDYRSPLTAAHSSGVAATSEELASRLGMPAPARRLIGVAGYLHDIGKLAIPTGLLDKPGKLTPAEMFVIRQHPYYTHQILSMVPGLETVNTWASLHHERLDGTGYPFRTGDIPLGSRIIAVADIFTAVTENRPYRSGMTRAQCLSVLDQLVADGAIDGDIVAVLRADYEAIHHIHSCSQLAAHA